eukprot:jgi/Mesen1/9882/ME000070S09164
MTWHQACARSQAMVQQPSDAADPTTMMWEQDVCSTPVADAFTRNCFRASEPVTCLLGPEMSTSSADSRAQRPPVLLVLSYLLDRVVAGNENQPQSAYSNKLTVFHGLTAPTISIDKYLERIHKYASCSPACFVVAYAYMDRLMRRNPELPLTSLSVHRLLITCIMAAAKFLDDAYFNNAFYAKVGGVTTGEMNRLELELLFRLDFRLHVTTAEFGAYCGHLEHQLRLSQAAAAVVERPLPFLCGTEYSLPAVTGPLSSTSLSLAGMHKRPALGRFTQQHDVAGDLAALYYGFDVHTPPREFEVYGPPGLVDRGQSMVQ